MKSFIIVLLSVFVFQSALADLKCPGDVFFSDVAEVDVSKKKTIDLYLNGVGKQSYLFVDLFYGALYLEAPKSNNKSIINSREVKVFTIHALRNLSEKQLVDQWDKEYEEQCEDQCDALRKYHEQFLSYARDVAKGERMSLAFLSNRLEFFSPTNEVFPPIMSPEYGTIMLKTAIGDKAISKKLKKGLLGKDKKLCKEI